MSSGSKKYLFIDRDGTLISEPKDHQIDSVDKFSLLPGVISSLKLLVDSGWTLVMVSNQDGLGSEQYPVKSFETIQRLLLQILGSEGISFHEITICPHFQIDGCRCRKPGVGLVQKYISSNQMDRQHSWVIGDRASDMELASNMGISGLLVSKPGGWAEIAKEILGQKRKAKFYRHTEETKIIGEIGLDEVNKNSISTGIPFFDHMLDQLSLHAGFSLSLQAEGDLEIDQHHLIEDTAIALGQALTEALGDKRGIGRYGFWLPMDEALSKATFVTSTDDAGTALDICGRSTFKFEGRFPTPSINSFDLEMVPHFFRSLSENMKMSLHIQATGENSHHMVESIFKSVGRSLRSALTKTNLKSIPSTKGSL